jgi:hypothetical protein
VSTDTDTCQTTFSGPFPTREIAERVSAYERRMDSRGSTIVFTVAPLYRPSIRRW